MNQDEGIRLALERLEQSEQENTRLAAELASLSSDEAVEAAAKVWAENGPAPAVWANVSERVRTYSLARMRLALTAARRARPPTRGDRGGGGHCARLAPHRRLEGDIPAKYVGGRSNLDRATTM